MQRLFQVANTGISQDNKKDREAGKGHNKGMALVYAIPLLECLERETGFEPATLCLGSKCATVAPLPLGVSAIIARSVGHVKRRNGGA